MLFKTKLQEPEHSKGLKIKVIRNFDFQKFKWEETFASTIVKLETTFHILKLPTIEFFQTLLHVFFFLSKSSIQHMSLNFLMGSAETGNKTSASKLQVGSKHSHNVFQIIKLEAKVPDHFHISFRVFWLLLSFIF